MASKPVYTVLDREEADELILEACQRLSKKIGKDIHPSGLPPQFTEVVMHGVPQMRYWKANQPATWLTDEEAAYDENDPNADDSILEGILIDPVKWAEWEFGIVCRPAQAQILRSTAKNKVFRISRRGGKTWTLIIYMLWFIYVYPNAEVILLTPSEQQLDNIFNIIKNHFFSRPVNRHWMPVQEGGIIISQRKKPSYSIEIQSISGTSFITGNVCSSNIRGRGTENCVIIFDEFDFIEDEAAILAVLAIPTQNPDIGVIVASTPSGRRGMYWKFCTDRLLGYEEHHWTVWEANPVWTIETAIQEILNRPWNSYLQEYEADFGEEEAGWIPKELIERSISFENFAPNVPGSDYYDNRGPIDPGSPIRTMGVDWDKMGTVGPSLVITELDRRIQKMRVIHSEVIARSGGSAHVSEFTLGNAVRRIIALNDQYNPHYIYCDRGYGERQIEELHEYGLKNPDSGLSHKVRGVSFSEKIRVHDYVTGETVKKHIKQVMASEMRQWFYENRIVISRYRSDLIRQLENYRVVGVTSIGYKFNDDDEHLVDGLMLAIQAVSENFDELFQKWVPIHIAGVDRSLSDFNRIDDIIDRDIEPSGNIVAPVVIPGQPAYTRGNIDGRFSAGLGQERPSMWSEHPRSKWSDAPKGWGR